MNSPPPPPGFLNAARTDLPARVLTATLAIVALGTPSLAQQTTFIREESMGKLPVDVEVTPNGMLAIVRGHAPGSDANDGLVVIEAATGLKLQLDPACGSFGLGGFYETQPSDFVRVTNSRAILVGGRDTDGDTFQDRTYVDVLAFDISVDPPTVSCLGHHELGSTSQGNMNAGWVNDVEITPDGALAIVNSQNWIHVVNMSTGAIESAFNIGNSPWAGPCHPGGSDDFKGAADSIAVTNSTAVVTTTREVFISPYLFARTWVYLIDLDNAPPTIELEHELAGPQQPGEEERDFGPHDVVITPNGAYGIVSADNAVGVYALATHSFLSRHVQPYAEWRFRDYPEIVDSIEATDSRFVVTATDFKYFQLPPPSQNLETRLWTADVFGLPPQAGAMSPMFSYNLRDHMTYGGAQGPGMYYGEEMFNVDVPHDVVVDGQENMAVFRSGRFNVILTDLMAPGA